jgi:hypothetical protein
MKNLETFESFTSLNEATRESKSNHSDLVKFMKTTLRDEAKGYYWIFTNSSVSDGVFRGNINDTGGHGKYSKSEVEKDLKNDQEIVDQKLKLLKTAIDEFNRENKASLKFTYTLNKPIIKTSTRQGDTVYDADSMVASVIIK